MYFAQIDEQNKVLQVIIADNEFINTQSGTWIQCDIDGITPKNYPHLNDAYDAQRNAFIRPQPFPSWILNETTCRWEAPTPKPENMLYARWNEETLSWDAHNV